MKKHLLILSLLGLMMVQNIGFSNAIGASDWSIEVLKDMHKRGLIEDLTIDFKQNITRKAFVDFLIPSLERVLGKSFDHSAKVLFSDVPASEAINVNKAYELGIISGTREGVFDPEGILTREQTAVILVKTLEMLGQHGEPPLVLSYKSIYFSDYDKISPWARGYVVLAMNNELMTGAGVNTFDPQSKLTNEQAMVISNRLFNHLRTNAQRHLLKKHHETLGTTLAATLLLAQNKDLIIDVDLLDLKGKSERAVEAFIGRASHEGKDLESDSKLLVYPVQGLLIRISDDRVAGFSVDNTLSNDFFKGKIGDLKRTYDIAMYEDKTHMRKEVLEDRTLIYHTHAIRNGKDLVELIWDESGTYLGLIYRFIE